MSDDPANPRDVASLYQATLAPLRRYLARLLGNQAEAQDVAHDAYLRVYPSVNRKVAERPEALLYVTARRLAINRLKRRSISPFTREELKPDAAVSSRPGVAQEVMARQELRLLEQAISQLPEGCRAVLLLRKIEMLSHREIAERLEFHYPPFYRLIRLSLKGKDHVLLDNGAQHFADRLRSHFGARVLGPEFPPVSKVRNEFVKDILIKVEREANSTKMKEIIWREIIGMKAHVDFKALRVVAEMAQA